MTAEFLDESNPLLFQMFRHGYDAWIETKRAKDATLLRELGIDMVRLQSMSLDELDAWLKEAASDPVKKARIEAQFSDPGQRAETLAYWRQMDEDFVKLLEREDARPLLLAPEEIGPAIPLIAERMESAKRLHPELFARTNEAPAGGKLAEVIRPILREICQAVYTPERIEQLVSQLRKLQPRAILCRKQRHRRMRSIRHRLAGK